MRITKSSVRAFSGLGQKGAFSGIGMLEAARINPDIRAVVADSVAIASLNRFQNEYPDKVINVGIAEQNMIGIASGLASEAGFQVFAFTYAEFLILRAFEQIRQNLSYQQFNVKLVGNSAGFAMGGLGVSHWAVQDVAIMRSLPDITILSAADSLEAVKIALALVEFEGPVYVRLSGGLNCPVVYESDFDYKIGKSNIIREGRDVAVIATGLMVREAINVAEILDGYGISCTVVDMHTINPLDCETVDNMLRSHRLVVTVEEHSRIGGLGSCIAEYRTDKNIATPLLMIGAEQFYAKLGSQRYIWDQYGLTSDKISKKIINYLKSSF